MTSITVSGAGSKVLLNYTSTDASSYASILAAEVSAGLSNGTLTAFNYTGGPTAPGPASGTGGLALITATPTSPVAIPTTDSVSIISAPGPATITGGAAGETVIAGSGGLTYTSITPSGLATDYIIAGDGANAIATPTTGNYSVATGSGNDSISIAGNATVNPGTGFNTVSASGGSNLVYSEGYDSITGSTVVGAGGTDTVNIGSGQATINPGTSNFFVYASSEPTNPLVLKAGTGSDTISVGSGGGNIVAGSGGNSVLFGGIGGVASAPTVLHGTASGDQIYAIGGGSVTATAGAGNETITGAGGSPSGYTVPGSTGNNTFTAGSGNDTLTAGGGHDTLIGGAGTAVMQSGTGPDTFSFTFGSGGANTITGFKSTDTLQLNGYEINTVPAFTSGGSTVVALNDGTTITLTGVSSLNPSQVVLK
jgi:Ca2+-binding RTX toxin-like protein